MAVIMPLNTFIFGVWNGFQRGGVSVCSCPIASFAFHLEADLIRGIRTKVTMLVDYLYGKERKVFAIGCNHAAIG